MSNVDPTVLGAIVVAYTTIGGAMLGWIIKLRRDIRIGRFQEKDDERRSRKSEREDKREEDNDQRDNYRALIAEFRSELDITKKELREERALHRKTMNESRRIQEALQNECANLRERAGRAETRIEVLEHILRTNKIDVGTYNPHVGSSGSGVHTPLMLPPPPSGHADPSSTSGEEDV